MTYTTETTEPTLTVGAANDVYEQQADDVANQIMRMPEQPFVQRKCACEDKEQVQRKPLTSLLQRKADAGGSRASQIVTNQIQATKGGGTPLHATTRSFMESRFGTDFSGVNIHTGSDAVQLSRELNAQAFTVGNDIYFNAGKFAPDSSEGKQLLAHELTHTVQQKSASVSETSQPIQRKACNFYSYDSTEPTKLGTAWSIAATTLAVGAYGGYSVASSDTIEYLLKRIINTYYDKDCDCIEELQFLSHGSPGNSMYISKTGDEITAADFNIPDLDKYGQFPEWWDMTSPYSKAWGKWFNGLTWRQQLFAEVRSLICKDAEIYYRSCSAFQGKTGQEFAEQSANFWRSDVIGHTKLIGLTQPGQKTLSPGQKAYWDEAEGADGTEMKKRGSKPKK